MNKLERYIAVGQKRLRCGYTTGTCAAAAARAAAELLLAGEAPAEVEVSTPSGVDVRVEVEQSWCAEGRAWAGVVKDAGDDPDVTDGVTVLACVQKSDEQGVVVDGGAGVGRVTRAGLDQPVGAAAINSVPRQMIAASVEEAARAQGYAGGLRVEISIPRGAELARKTFNPRLGIEGGLSVLGTSGLVKPMSEEALVSSIQLEMRMNAAAGVRDVLMCPGNYGADFARDELGLDLTRAVQCSNYVGASIDYACQLNMRSVLLVAHVGKLVKVAAGVMNTHSRVADARLETLAAHAALVGATRAVAQAVMESATTDAALDHLAEAGVLEPTMRSVMGAIEARLRARAGDALAVEAICFSKTRGLLGATSGADALLETHRRINTGDGSLCYVFNASGGGAAGEGSGL